MSIYPNVEILSIRSNEEFIFMKHLCSVYNCYYKIDHKFTKWKEVVYKIRGAYPQLVVKQFYAKFY